jgi:ADP-heptose:LPS heptosyltransferase
LDSTTIAALAQEIANTPVHTVTMGFREFRGGAEDEVPLAELVARQYGTVHHTHWVTKDDFRDEYDNVMQAMDQPSIDGINSYFVSKAAAEAGLKVALSGLGGDELFGGYPSFRQLPALVGALKPFKSIPFLGKGFRLLSAGTMRKFTSPKYAGLLEYGTSYGGAYLLRRGMYMPWELPEVLDGEMVRQGWDELRALSHLEQTIQDVRNVHLKVTALETSWYMRNQLLRDADWASMAHSLEVRVPLVDIELFRAMAPLFNLSHAPGKLTMAQAPIKALPSQILQRKKTGFTIPVAQWLTSSGRGVATRGLRNWAIIVSREFGGGGSDKSDESRPTVLIFRTGQLGDTLVALPAIATIRREYPNHRLILLTDRHSNSKEYVSSWEICKPAGWFDDVIFYDPGSRGWAAMAMWFSVVRGLRGINVHHFFNLAPGRTKWQSVRDAIIFKGLGRVVNYHPPVPLRSPKPDHKGALPWVEPEWQQTLRGIDADLAEDQAFKLPIPESDRQMARRVAQADGIDFGRKLLAFGPGSKMPAKIWPIGRFAELGERLQEEFPELQLVVLGGEEDVAKGNELCANWGRRSHNLAGRLSLYGSASVLEACTAYVGNDTGIMHLAAMAGTRCVAIFSARDFPGRWTPYGKGHVILRRDVQCGGCLLEVCTKYENKCLTLISVDEVHEATKQILAAASK